MLGSLPASKMAGLPYWEGTMTTKFIISVLLVSALATPASAGNWFHNPHLNINRNIGSAPNPTPADIREMRLPVVTQTETPVQGYTVIEPAKDSNKQAAASPLPAQGAPGAVAQAS